MALFAPQWPLAMILPTSICAFYGLYFGLKYVAPRCVPQYNSWPDISKQIFRQNLCAVVHTYVLIVLLVIVLATQGAEMQAAGLRPFYSPLAYVGIGMSLGYMCLTLPWSMRMYFSKNERVRKATRPTLIVHHWFVVLAEIVYLLTLTSPWHGSLSFLLFESSKIFLMPHHLMTQLNYHGPLHFLNGLCFFITCTLARVAGCLVLGVAYVYDYATFSDAAEAGGYGWGIWLAIGLSLLAFWMILVLSMYWYVNDVLAETHKELKMSLGDDYLKRLCSKCCPCGVMSRPIGTQWAAIAEGQCASRALLRRLVGAGADLDGALGIGRARAQWACNTSFPRRLDGVRCDGLAPRTNVSTAAECQAACCASMAPPKSADQPPKPSCHAWQWCASADHCGGDFAAASRCWLGGRCTPARGVPQPQPGWVGAARAQVLGHNVRGVVRSHEQLSLAHELGACVTRVRPDLLPRPPPKKKLSATSGVQHGRRNASMP